MVPEFSEELCIQLESAIMYGENDELLNFLASENATADDYNFVLKKIGENLDDCYDFPDVLNNILTVIREILSIADLSVEHILILSRSLLSVSSYVNCDIAATKQVLHLLNKFLENQQVASSLIDDKSLENVIVALGKKLFVVGDYDCQTVMFEAICRLVSTINDQIYWADLWFSTKQLKDKFLHLRQDQFEQDSRKILNCINRMEPIPRVFSFVAKSVWLGELQLEKPQDSDFWIDLSFGSQMISFFCSEIASEEDDPLWETVSISVKMIDDYSICDYIEEKTTTLTLQLKCSCDQLISTNSEDVHFGRDEVKITFWCPGHNVKKLVARLLEEDYEVEKIDLNENVPILKRKISVSTEITSCEEFEDTEASVIKRRKLSETSDLLNVNELQENEAIQQGHRKISETENLMNVFEIMNDPVLPSIGRKLSEIDELMETHQIEETNILPKKVRKHSQSIEIITSEDNETNAISIEQVKTAIDEVMKTNTIEKLNDTVAVPLDDLMLPSLDVFCDKEPLMEDIDNDTEAKKKKDTSSTKKRNSKKKVEKKKVQRETIIDEDFDSKTVENKKPRAAALNAKKKNKNLLLQKELDENSIHSSTVKRKHENEDDVSCYSPKKKNKVGSIFQTDTETQSSEISWFKRGKHGLFQTPPLKNYTRKNTKGRTSLKKGKQGKIQKKKEYWKKNKFFDDRSSESGTKSKSMGLSDVDKFSLIVEKENPKKLAPTRKSTKFYFELVDSVNEKQLYASSEEYLGPNFTDNDISGRHSDRKFSNKLSLPKDAKSNIIKDNQSLKTKPVKQKEKVLPSKDLKTDDEKSKLKKVRKLDTSVKGTYLNAFNKIHDDLGSSMQNSKFKHINQNNYSKSEGDQVDINIQCPEALYDSSESRNEFTTDLNIQEDKCDLSKPSSLPDVLQTDENVCRTLSIESLNSLEQLQNEEKGKKLHMKLFLESLSSESPPPPSDMEDFCATVVSKRSSSHYSYSIKEIPCKKIKTDRNQTGKSDLRFSPKKTEKKNKQKLNKEIGSIVKNQKSERIFVHSEKKSSSSPNKQLKDRKQNKTALRIHPNINKNVSKMKQMSSKEKINMEKNLSYSVLTKLASEVNLLTKKLFGTLQKCTWNFCNELNILRSNFLFKIEDMISHNTNLSERDLKKLALNCKESRLQIQTNLEQIMEFGRIYFEAERMKEKKLKNVHRKITVKYCCHLRAAVEVAVKSIEERIVGRAGAMFKKFLQGI